MNHERDGETYLREVRSEVRETVDAVRVEEQATVQFLLGLQQELATPLNAIMGLAQVMRNEGLGPIDSALYRDCLGDIDECAQHLHGLINEIVARAKDEQAALSSAA